MGLIELSNRTVPLPIQTQKAKSRSDAEKKTSSPAGPIVAVILIALIAIGAAVYWKKKTAKYEEILKLSQFVVQLGYGQLEMYCSRRVYLW